jgi:hypothetical protein
MREALFQAGVEFKSLAAQKQQQWWQQSGAIISTSIISRNEWNEGFERDLIQNLV